MDKKETAMIMPSEVTKVITIKTPEDLTEATSTLSVLNKALDFLTEKKKKLTKPANEILAEVRARYKEPETLLKNKIEEIRAMMTAYANKQDAIAERKEEKITEKLASGDISIEKAADALSKLPEAPKNVATDEGSVKFKPVPKCEVEDLSKVPLEYHKADDVKIRAAMLEGTKLPGVRYWIDQVPYNSR